MSRGELTAATAPARRGISRIIVEERSSLRSEIKSGCQVWAQVWSGLVMPPDDALDRGGATGSFARLGRDPGPEKWRRWRGATSGVLPTNSPLPVATCILHLAWKSWCTCYLHHTTPSKRTTGVWFPDSPNSWTATGLCFAPALCNVWGLKDNKILQIPGFRSQFRSKFQINDRGGTVRPFLAVALKGLK